MAKPESKPILHFFWGAIALTVVFTILKVAFHVDDISWEFVGAPMYLFVFFVIFVWGGE